MRDGHEERSNAMNELEVEDHLAGYRHAQENQADAACFSRSPEYLLGYAIGIGDIKRNSYDVGVAEERVRTRLEEDRERRIARGGR